MRWIFLIWCALALGGRPAGADDTAFDDAPDPRKASGVTVERERPSETWRWAPRALLFVPKVGWQVVWAGPRLGMWAYDRYQVKDRIKGLFFNDSGTAGLYPVAFVETGFGLNAGARLILRDALGSGARFRVRASYGGRLRQLYSAKLTTGELLGDRVELELIGEYQLFPKDRFAGIGNGDTRRFDPAAVPIDPLTSDAAVLTRYRHDDWKVEGGMVVGLTRHVAVRASVALKHRTFDDDVDVEQDVPIFGAYDTARLVGYDTGLYNAYGELELMLDTRRARYFWQSGAAPSAGWRASAFAGYQLGIGDDPSDHARWGVDVQRYFDLYGGDRVLLVRGYVESIAAGELHEVPFVDLPRLGGPVFLRGYDRDRFRDRSLALATIEYDYPIARGLGGYLFVDAGRVYRSVEDFELDGMRVGFGVGVQAHTLNSFLARVFIATSIDGGFVANLSFDPVFDTRSREESP